VRDEPHVPNSIVGDPLEIATNVAQPARVYNYLAGGDANFAVDREVGDYLSSVEPGEVDLAREAARAQAGFMTRVTRYLVVEAGIRQFLYIGATAPSAEQDLHEVAQEAAPDTRVVYVGRDPVVLAHAHALCPASSEGTTAYIHGTLHRPAKLLAKAAETLDLSRPVAIALIGVLNFYGDDQDPYGLVARLLDGTSAGSYLVLAHSTNEAQPDVADAVAERLTQVLRRTYVQRSRAQVERFFAGLELVEDGLVQIDQWHRHEHDPLPGSEESIPIYGGVARKP
jgi:hypothetical protein